jgi:hypothetical protein
MTIFRETICEDTTGKCVEIDKRIFSLCVEMELKEIRRRAMEEILKAAPDYKQRNAALGLLSQQEIGDMKTQIQNIRTISNQKEAEILAVVWDGTEASRPAACDAVQSVRWD